MITTPAELIKIHQQSLVRSAPSAPLMRDRDVMLHIWRHHGLRGFYRGITATALRDVGYGAYFAAYEIVKGMLTPAGSKDLNLGAVIFAGGMAGVAMWSIAIPPDVRLRSASVGVGNE